MTLRPSKEQKQFIETAKEGKNILVDACIGSGKTTAIQKLCMSLPADKRILYLTYNKLLKLDAQNKIKSNNVLVQNYHGFAYMVLAKANIRAGVADLIKSVTTQKPAMSHYDVLIIDEYQDIELEIAEMLEYIKEENPGIQIIAVGDMDQKIYDKTSLDVKPFIENFLGEYTQLEFTQCFRLSGEYAEMLGRIWNKDITGVNSECEIEVMDRQEAYSYILQQEPSKIMCLGSRTGAMSNTLNRLEQNKPDKFNKHTVYASINNSDGFVIPSATSAIFTTFDSSKGLERDICVIFDYNESYWNSRIKKPQQKYDILKNIFLVAASRGKKKIIFVKSDNKMLTEKILSTPEKTNMTVKDMLIPELFAFKYREDVEDAYSQLSIKTLDTEASILSDIQMTDGLIDLAPCINIYQIASYFNNYDIDVSLELLYRKKYNIDLPPEILHDTVENKILLMTALMTNQMRYKHQVRSPFVSKDGRNEIHDRLSTQFNKNAKVQCESSIEFTKKGKTIFKAIGYADIIQDDILYQLHYTSEVSHEKYLECACYMLGAGLTKSIIWNIRNNTMTEITIKDTEKFLDTVLRTATKGLYKKNT